MRTDFSSFEWKQFDLNFMRINRTQVCKYNNKYIKAKMGNRRLTANKCTKVIGRRLWTNQWD